MGLFLFSVSYKTSFMGIYMIPKFHFEEKEKPLFRTDSITSIMPKKKRKRNPRERDLIS
jgi:hypothetical protein